MTTVKNLVFGLLAIGPWLIFFLASGYPIFCLLRTFGKRTLRLDWIELLFASSLLGSLVIGWLGLLLAELGIFNLFRLAGVLFLVLAGTVIGLRARRGTLRPLVCPSSPRGWLILLLLGLAVAVFFHPHQFIIGGADAGVYVNVGASIARTGSILIHEEGLADLASSLWPGLFPHMGSGESVRYLRFPGFYLPGDVPDLVIPQFFPLHPVWLAIGYSLLGLRASLYVAPLWAALGVLAVGLALKRAFDTRVGILGAILLLATPTQIYFARYPTSEPLTQFLVWAGLYAFLAFVADEHPLWGVLGGLALGQVFLTRIDALPLLLLPLALLIYALRRRSWQGQLWFFAPFGTLLLHSILHSLLFSRPYVWDVYSVLWQVGVQFVRQAGWFLIALLLSAAAFTWVKRRSTISVAKSQEIARWAGAAALIAMGLFAYLVWPQMGHVTLVQFWHTEAPIPVQNHLNLVRLAWYLSPLGVWLGIAGVALMVLKGNARRIWPVMLTGLTFSILYLYNIMNNPVHIYGMRRYVPVVFPFFTAAMAHALMSMWDQRRVWRPAASFALVLGLALLGCLLYNDRAVWKLVEYHGLIPQVESLARELQPGAVLLFDDEALVGAGSTIGTPLQYVYGFTAFDLQEDQVDPKALLEAIADWQASGRVVYWVMGPHSSMDAHAPLTLLPATATWIRTPCLEQSHDHFPTRVQECAIPLEFYKVAPQGIRDLCDFPTEVDIGNVDSLYVREGFHPKERKGDLTVRWTAGDAVLQLPCLPASLPETVSITAHIAAPRPDGLGPAHLVMEVDGEPIGEWEVGHDFQAVEAQIRGTMLEGPGHTLTLHSDTWIPQQHDVSTDVRTLGVKVDSVAIAE